MGPCAAATDLGGEACTVGGGLRPSSALPVTAFCQREAVSPARFYRWLALLSSRADAAHVQVVSALPPTQTGFVDQRPLIPTPSSPSFELHLDLGGGLMLHLVRR